jgi:hypothetical protein
MKITETMHTTTSNPEETEKTIGQEVADNYRRAEIFKKIWHRLFVVEAKKPFQAFADKKI